MYNLQCTARNVFKLQIVHCALYTVHLVVFAVFFPCSIKAQTVSSTSAFPVITRLDSRDTVFKQYISDVEGNRRRLAMIRNRVTIQKTEESAEYLTIYQYTLRTNDDLFSVAARCNIPYSALAGLNRIADSASINSEGQVILLPSYPGLYIPADYQSDIEKLLAASRLEQEESIQIRVNRNGASEVFHFIPGADFTPTERTFFLNTGLRFPLRFFRLTSAFGLRQSPITGNIIMHEGLDLAAPEGTEVYAITDGTVTTIGDDPIYGIYIIITHKNGLTSLYGHLSKVETTLQTTVKSGTLIGRVGSTGQSTGPHLHFELRQDGRPINPSGRLRH